MPGAGFESSGQRDLSREVDLNSAAVSMRSSSLEEITVDFQQLAFHPFALSFAENNARIRSGAEFPQGRRRESAVDVSRCHSAHHQDPAMYAMMGANCDRGSSQCVPSVLVAGRVTVTQLGPHLLSSYGETVSWVTSTVPTRSLKQASDVVFPHA